MNNLAENYSRNFTVLDGGKKSNKRKSKARKIIKKYIKTEMRAAKKLYKILVKKLINKTDVMLHIRLFTIVSIALIIGGFVVLAKATAMESILLIIRNVIISSVMILTGCRICAYDLKRKYK